MSALWLAVGSEAAKGEAAKSGPWGFAIILILAVACYFLFRSMSRHMKYVREHPPTELDGRASTGTGAVAGGSGAASIERTAGENDADTAPPAG